MWLRMLRESLEASNGQRDAEGGMTGLINQRYAHLVVGLNREEDDFQIPACSNDCRLQKWKSLQGNKVKILRYDIPARNHHSRHEVWPSTHAHDQSERGLVLLAKFPQDG